MDIPATLHLLADVAAEAQAQGTEAQRAMEGNLAALGYSPAGIDPDLRFLKSTAESGCTIELLLSVLQSYAFLTCSFTRLLLSAPVLAPDSGFGPAGRRQLRRPLH
ncbi:hypothetical protein GCM10009650_14870 [Nesterenkonia jeotgali]